MAAYITREDANTYFAARLFTAEWDAASDSDKDKALTMATDIIDSLAFNGVKANAEQENQFPRGLDTSVPVPVQRACAEIAKALLEGIEPDKEANTLNIESHGIGSLKVNLRVSQVPEHRRAGIPSYTAWKLLNPYLNKDRNVELHRIN